MSTLNEDFVDLLDALDAANVEYVLVGAHAMAAHGVARATGDLDVLLRASPANGRRVIEALIAFGAPVDAHGIGPNDFAVVGAVYQMGLPPRRIDLLTRIDGVSFQEVWHGRARVPYANRTIDVIGLAELARNKAATGRTKDLLDLELLREAGLIAR